MSDLERIGWKPFEEPSAQDLLMMPENILLEMMNDRVGRAEIQDNLTPIIVLGQLLQSYGRDGMKTLSKVIDPNAQGPYYDMDEVLAEIEGDTLREEQFITNFGAIVWGTMIIALAKGVRDKEIDYNIMTASYNQQITGTIIPKKKVGGVVYEGLGSAETVEKYAEEDPTLLIFLTDLPEGVRRFWVGLCGDMSESMKKALIQRFYGFHRETIRAFLQQEKGNALVSAAGKWHYSDEISEEEERRDRQGFLRRIDDRIKTIDALYGKP